MDVIPASLLLHHPCRLFHNANSLTQADLYELEWEGVDVILKDYGGLLRRRRRLLGRLIGYFTVRRETEALNRLQGLPAHPRLIARVGKCALLYERVDGKMLPNYHQNQVCPALFDQLAAAIDAMHKRGVAHADLRRNNIFLSGDGKVHILDYETAVLDNGRPNSIRGRVFRLICKVDRTKLVRMRHRWFPEIPLAPEDERLLSSEPVVLRLARAIRQNLYRRFIKRIRR